MFDIDLKWGSIFPGAALFWNETQGTAL